jgi:hypothetical protein
VLDETGWLISAGASLHMRCPRFPGFFIGLFTRVSAAIASGGAWHLIKALRGIDCNLRLCNAEVGSIHPKAMPTILRTADDVERWLTAPAEDVPKLQQALPDGSLKIVARSTKEDGPPSGPGK